MKIEIKTPAVPNFVAVHLGPGTEPQYRSVGDFDDPELEQIASEWKRELFEKAHRQREQLARLRGAGKGMVRR